MSSGRKAATTRLGVLCATGSSDTLHHAARPRRTIPAVGTGGQQHLGHVAGLSGVCERSDDA